MDKDFMLNYYDKMVRPIWTELMKTPRYQRAACERDKIERESGKTNSLQRRKQNQSPRHDQPVGC